ncbi:MAG: MFS transporter [Alphaproteobacteria bacterium]|nr:MFS transporter [Alphaproteobacteria bacterium]
MTPSTQTGRPLQSIAFLRERRTALLLFFLAFALSILDRQILSILAEPIRKEFNLSDTSLALLSGFAFAMFYATLGIPLALIADRGNRKRIVVWSLAIFSGMTFLTGLAQNFWQLALARFGVGIGEAGVNPSSHSILADYYPPEKRSSALSVLAMGANVGMLLALVAGGVVSQLYGWRTALFVVGFPGILLALVMAAALKEAPRGFSENRRAAATPPPLRKSLGYLWGSLAMRHIILASTLSATVTYGVSAFQPAFFARIHQLSQMETGFLLAGLLGVVGGVGAVTGGWLTDKLQTRNPAWGVWMIGVVQLISLPFTAVAYLAGSPALALAWLVVPVFFGNFFLGPSLALIQTLAPLRMRAISAAVKMLIMNLVGLSCGPLIVGAVSDALKPAVGDDSLRYALLSIHVLGFWSALHFFLCGRNMAAGIEAAKED